MTNDCLTFCNYFKIVKIQMHNLIFKFIVKLAYALEKNISIPHFVLKGHAFYNHNIKILQCAFSLAKIKIQEGNS